MTAIPLNLPFQSLLESKLQLSLPRLQESVKLTTSWSSDKALSNSFSTRHTLAKRRARLSTEAAPTPVVAMTTERFLPVLNARELVGAHPRPTIRQPRLRHSRKRSSPSYPAHRQMSPAHVHPRCHDACFAANLQLARHNPWVARWPKHYLTYAEDSQPRCRG